MTHITEKKVGDKQGKTVVIHWPKKKCNAVTAVMVVQKQQEKGKTVRGS